MSAASVPSLAPMPTHASSWLATLWLAAQALGLGLGWVSILDPAAVAAALDVPPGWTFIGHFCLGYPQSEDEAPELERLGWERRRPAGSAVIRR